MATKPETTKAYRRRRSECKVMPLKKRVRQTDGTFVIQYVEVTVKIRKPRRRG